MLSSFKDVFTEIPKAYNSLSLVKYLSEIFLVLGSFDIHECRTPFVTPSTSSQRSQQTQLFSCRIT
jgi:hypothetical protein